MEKQTTSEEVTRRIVRLEEEQRRLQKEIEKLRSELSGLKRKVR